MRSIHRGLLGSVILACLFLSSVLAQDKSRTQPTAASEALPEEHLANALALLKTDDERSALLTAEKELVTERLVRELNRQGTGLRVKGNYPEALARFRFAQKIAEQIGDKAGIASTLNNIGGVYWSQGNYAQALEIFQKSLAVSEAIGDKAEFGSTLNNIGLVHLNQGNYALALEYFEKSLAIREALGDKAGFGGSLSNIGLVQLNQGNFAQALEHFQKSLELYEALGDKARIAIVLYNIGLVHRNQGNYAQALEYSQKGLAMSEALGNKDGIARMLNSIGVVHYLQGNYEQALDIYQRSLAMREALGDKAGIAITLTNIGRVRDSQGNYVQALEIYQKSLALYEAIGNKDGIARTLPNIGNIYYGQGNSAQALEIYQKCLTMSEALGDKVGITSALGNIGNVYSSQGNYAQALEYFQKGLALSEASGNKDGIARILNNIGNVHDWQGNYEQALEIFQKSLALREALGDKAGVSDTLTDMGNASRLKGNYAQALDFARRAAVLAKQFGYPIEFLRAQNEAGQAYRALNQFIPARQAFEDSIATIEKLRAQVAGGEQEQQRSFEGSLGPYQGIVELLVEQKQFSAALGYAERAKARVLLDVLHSGRIDVTKAMTAAEQDQERFFHSQLVSLNTQISRENQRAQPDAARLNDLKAQLQKVRLDYEAFQTGLYAAHPGLKTQRGEIEALTTEQARALLPDSKSALLEYVVANERAYLFALTANGTTTELKAYPLEIKQKELEDRVARYRETLASGSPAFRQPASELYDLLLKPAAAQLQGRTSLIIVPDGALWELPFQTLQPGPNCYLIEDAAIAYAPSLTALREMNKLRQGKKSTANSSTLLAFGNPALGKQNISGAKPVLMDENLEPLPEAERQVNEIKQIYGAAKSRVYIGAAANEEHVKAEAGSYRILHLATHGILNDSSPMYSYLQLALTEGDRNEDGLLEAWEIMKLDLQADLVVLSACETARGRVGTGEGMIGLSWALFIAGSPTSVLSQWKVDSASTTELMVEFHRQLKAQMANPTDSFSAARALREADLKLLRSERYRHPFYWAGFVVTGKGF
jgi:CHAT domain-containing protein/Tfp pilus assembly protein PilF